MGSRWRAATDNKAPSNQSSEHPAEMSAVAQMRERKTNGKSSDLGVYRLPAGNGWRNRQLEFPIQSPKQRTEAPPGWNCQRKNQLAADTTIKPSVRRNHLQSPAYRGVRALGSTRLSVCLLFLTAGVFHSVHQHPPSLSHPRRVYVMG